MTTLRETLYETLHKNPRKPLKLIAEELGMSESYLTRAALPDQEDSDTGSGCRFPLKKLVPLIQITRDFSVLDHIERSLGRIAIKAPSPAATTAEIYRLTMQSVKEFGDLMGELDRDLADDKLTEAEIEHILIEGNEAMQAIATLLHGLAATEKK